jgi:hypothetical protein
MQLAVEAREAMAEGATSVADQHVLDSLILPLIHQIGRRRSPRASSQFVDRAFNAMRRVVSQPSGERRLRACDPLSLHALARVYCHYGVAFTIAKNATAVLQALALDRAYGFELPSENLQRTAARGCTTPFGQSRKNQARREIARRSH